MRMSQMKRGSELKEVDPLRQNPPANYAGHEMETLQLAAQMIMENGGETYRAEETVRRMGEGFGLHQVESFAVPSGLFISYRTPDGQLVTSVKRVHNRRTDLTLVNEVNQVSREASAGMLSSREALMRLQALEDLSAKPSAVSALAAAICAGGFVFLFQGNWQDSLVSAAVAALVQCAAFLLARIHDPGIAATILGGLLTAFLPALAVRWIPGLNAEAIVAGALMPLVPGLAMTNAVQDTLRGDMVSGLSHGVSALLTACLIAGGALLSPALIRLLSGGGL